MTEIFFTKSGKGYPLIFIHGFCETHEIWSGFANELSKEFTVYTLDLPGFGRSQALAMPFSIRDVAIAVNQWVGIQKIQKPILVGHSLGGYVALAAIAENAEAFGGLCLFHSTPLADSEDRKANRNRVMEFVKNHGKDPFIDTFVPSLFFNKEDESIRIVDSIVRKTSQEALINYTVAMRDRPATVDIFGDFNLPVMVLAGEKDAIISKESIKELSQLYTSVNVHFIQKVAHMGMFEAPQKCLGLIRAFAVDVHRTKES